MQQRLLQNYVGLPEFTQGTSKASIVVHALRQRPGIPMPVNGVRTDRTALSPTCLAASIHTSRSALNGPQVGYCFYIKSLMQNTAPLVRPSSISRQ